MKKIIFLATMVIGMATIACAQQPAQSQSQSKPQAPKVEKPAATMTHTSCKNAHRCPHSQRACQQQPRVNQQNQSDSTAVRPKANARPDAPANKPRRPRNSSK